VHPPAHQTAEDAGKQIGLAVEKSGKVTVYDTKAYGHKVAHFFEKMLYDPLAIELKGQILKLPVPLDLKYHRVTWLHVVEGGLQRVD